LVALILSIPVLAQEGVGLHFYTDAKDPKKIVGLSILNATQDWILDNRLGDFPYLGFIEVSKDSKKYSSEDGVLYNKDKTKLLYCPPAKRGKLVIPQSVEKLEGGISRCVHLTSVTFPDSAKDILQLIKYDAFSGNYYNSELPALDNSDLSEIIVSPGNPYYSSEDGLLYNKDKTALLYCPFARQGKIILPESVKRISLEAFYKCEEIVTVVLNDSVRIDDRSCFNSCKKLASIEVSKGNPNYASQDGILYDKNKTKIILFPINLQGDIQLSRSLKRINDIFEGFYHPFYGNDKYILYIPNTVTDIRSLAFMGCRTRIKPARHNSIKKIGFEAFTNSNLDSLFLDSIESIDASAFQHCLSLKSVVITSDSLKEIPKSAFEHCLNLEYITLPKSITKIGESAFADCRSLKEITVVCGKPPKLKKKDLIFHQVDLSTCVLGVPKGRWFAYRTAKIWRKFKHIKTVKE